MLFSISPFQFSYILLLIIKENLASYQDYLLQLISCPFASLIFLLSLLDEVYCQLTRVCEKLCRPDKLRNLGDLKFLSVLSNTDAHVL